MSVADPVALVEKLPAPRRSGGRPLMECLGRRESVREYSSKSLPLALVSDLLWATFGVSRPDGKRTAPTSFDSREFDLYLLTAEAIHRYDATDHGLIHIIDGDFRTGIGFAEWIWTAPLIVVFVADKNRMTECPRELHDFCSAADVGFLCENLSLFCASEGLASCVIAGFDGAVVRQRLGLSPTQSPIMVQTVGYPK